MVTRVTLETMGPWDQLECLESPALLAALESLVCRGRRDILGNLVCKDLTGPPDPRDPPESKESVEMTAPLDPSEPL